MKSMITIATENGSNVVYTTASAKLTAADYDKLLPVLRETIDNYGKARWYFEMQGFDGWEMDALWKDLKFDVEHINDFEKIAAVGDKSWQDWVTQLIKLFTDA